MHHDIIANATVELMSEREEHDADNKTAEFTFADFVTSYNNNMQEMRERQREALESSLINNDIDIPGAPAGWKRPSAPDDWQVPTPKMDQGEPATFEAVDNPGSWTPYTYRAKFAQVKIQRDRTGRETSRSGGNYLYHALPTGAIPVPPNNNGNREMKGYTFHYNGWTSTEPSFRSAATSARQHRPGLAA